MHNQNNQISPKTASECRVQELIQDLTDKLKLLDQRLASIKPDSRPTSAEYQSNTKKRGNIFNNIKDAMLSSITNSSTHGHPNVYKSKRLAGKLMWAFFSIASTILCSWFGFN